MGGEEVTEKLISIGAAPSAVDGTETASPRSESSWHRLDLEVASDSEPPSVADADDADWVEAATPVDDSSATTSVDVPRQISCESAEDSVSIAHNGGVQQQVEAAERVYIILAAFDANGDEHLNVEEYNELQRAAWNGNIMPEAYQQLCADFGEDPEIGLGAEALMGIYAELGTLERDFAAAKARLEGSEGLASASSANVAEASSASESANDSNHWASGLRVSPLSAAVTALSVARTTLSK